MQDDNATLDSAETLARMGKTRKSLGDRLRKLRKSAGWSRKTAAASTGIPERTLVRYESGEREPPASVIVRVCRAYRVSADRLLGLRKAG